MSSKFTHCDRRVNTRYECDLEAFVCFADPSGTWRFGYAVKIDMGTSRLQFQTDYPPPPGTAAELRILWPTLLQGVCPLELVLKGKVVGTSSGGTEIQASTFEFRTHGTRSFVEPNQFASSLIA